MSLGNISVSYIDILCKTLKKLGHSEQQLLETFGVNRATLTSPNARVSIPKYMRMGNYCIGETKAPWFGLEMGKQTSLTHLGLAGLAALSAPNLKVACDCLTKYELLNTYNVRGKTSFCFDSQQAVMSFYSIKPYNEFNHFIIDLVLSGWNNAIATVTGRDNLVAQVCFEFAPPSYADYYRKYFDCEVLFSQPCNQLVLKKGAIDCQGLSACGTTFTMLERLAIAELDIVQVGLSFERKVSRAISPLLVGGTPALEQVAEQLNMAPWTVRRRLIDEGVSYQQVLNDTRCDMAKTYARDTALSLGEIAYLLGFGSATAFQRAFKRWTGLAPGGYRHQSRL